MNLMNNILFVGGTVNVNHLESLFLIFESNPEFCDSLCNHAILSICPVVPSEMFC